MNKAFLIAYFFFTFFFFAFFSSGIVDSQDGLQYLAIARRMYYDRTFQMPEADYPIDNIHMSATKNSRGERYSPTGLGFTLSLLPAVFVEDMVLRQTGSPPINAFPLQSDWPIHMVASLTNAFWGALFVLILFLYLETFAIKREKAALLAFILVISSNIFPYTKHVFAHMMFLTCMFATFYFIKKFSIEKNRVFLLAAGISFGVQILSYNPFFILTIPALGLYYLLLSKPVIKPSSLIEMAKDILNGIAGVLPFFLLYRWFNYIRFGMGSATGYGSGGIPLPKLPPLYVLFEGGWNVLLSPGKSIFVFSPLLLLLVFFWHKIPHRKLKPELIVFGIQFVIFFYFVSTLLGGVDYLVWHGESSWGPRYMLPILPGALVILGVLINHFSKITQRAVVIPLVLLGVFIQLCGILLPYQIKFAGLQSDITFNGRNWNTFEYANIIPRYSPVFNMSKTLVKRIARIPLQYDRGSYSLVLKDGFDRPFRPTPTEAWREILPVAQLSFANTSEPVSTIKMLILNHQLIPESSYSATVSFALNNASLSATNTIDINEEAWVTLQLGSEKLAENNVLQLQPSFIGTDSARLKGQQMIFIKSLLFNDEKQNLGLIDFPFVSPSAKDLQQQEYLYYGGVQREPWEIWHMRSGVYEETFDLWWLRPLHYWDLPKTVFRLLFIIQISGLLIPLYFLVENRKGFHDKKLRSSSSK